MLITKSCKLLDVLEAYPSLEEQIVNIAPPFKSLKNPILRRTVASLATIEKVAQIGSMDVARLVNTLRRHVGQIELIEESDQAEHIDIPRAIEDPEWISGEPQFLVNGTELLQRGEVPLGKVNELIDQLSAGGYILLLTNFPPSPIIDAMIKQNRQTFTKISPQNSSEHMTFIG